MARAYSQLSTTRAVGVGLGPIPVTAIWDYADRTGISQDPVLREFFVDVIRSVDAHTMHAAAVRRQSKG